MIPKTNKKGTVVVTVTLADANGQPVKKNERKTYRVGPATVLDVGQAIEKAIVAEPDVLPFKAL